MVYHSVSCDGMAISVLTALKTQNLFTVGTYGNMKGSNTFEATLAF